jgi:hypothetical protein
MTRNNTAWLRDDFDGLLRTAVALSAGFIVASCTRERAETTTTSSSSAIVAERRAPSEGVVPPRAAGIGCPDPSSYFIEVTGDAGTTVFRSSCANATGDFGAVGAVGGPFAPSSGAIVPAVLLEACSDRTSDSARISIVIGGTSASSAYLKDTLGNVFLSFQHVISETSRLQIGPLGGSIEGTYIAELYSPRPDGPGQVEGPTISGSFRVCHLQDVDLSR